MSDTYALQLSVLGDFARCRGSVHKSGWHKQGQLAVEIAHIRSSLLQVTYRCCAGQGYSATAKDMPRLQGSCGSVQHVPEASHEALHPVRVEMVVCQPVLSSWQQACILLHLERGQRNDLKESTSADEAKFALRRNDVTLLETTEVMLLSKTACDKLCQTLLQCIRSRPVQE